MTSNNSNDNSYKNVFSNQSEFETIAHLHDTDMANQVLSTTIQDLVGVVSYRTDANKHLQLCARQMNSFMRENYKGFIRNTGENIYPLIIASDFEPGKKIYFISSFY